MNTTRETSGSGSTNSARRSRPRVSSDSSSASSGLRETPLQSRSPAWMACILTSRPPWLCPINTIRRRAESVAPGSSRATAAVRASRSLKRGQRHGLARIVLEEPELEASPDLGIGLEAIGTRESERRALTLMSRRRRLAAIAPATSSGRVPAHATGSFRWRSSRGLGPRIAAAIPSAARPVTARIGSRSIGLDAPREALPRANRSSWGLTGRALLVPSQQCELVVQDHAGAPSRSCGRRPGRWRRESGARAPRATPSS